MDKKRIGRIEIFFNWIWDFAVFKMFTCVLAALLTIATICAVSVLEKAFVSDMWTYPTEEFQYLSTEVQKVIVDNSIDMTQITDNSIETSITYNKKAEDAEWSTCEIEVTRHKTVNATVIKDDNGKLTMDVTYNSKFDHFGIAFFVTMLGIGLSYTVFIFISAILVAIIYSIVWIMKIIEKVVLKHCNKI